MKTGRVVGGILLTASIVSIGSAVSGWQKKISEDKKHQSELVEKLKKTGISEDEFVRIEQQAKSKRYTFAANKVYEKALDSLQLKAQFEKMYLHSLDSLKSDSIKIITKTAK